MFLIELTYLKPLEIIDQYLVLHRAYLDDCYQKNFLIVSGPKNPRVGAILISQLKDKKQLEEIIKQDPFFINNLISFEIKEFMPVKFHPDFSSFIS